MRRGIDIRKKKRASLNESNKKSLQILSILIIIFAICMIVFGFFIQDIFIKRNFEKDSINFFSINENVPFSLQKIILFSSATANTNTINQYLSLDISHFCDIGIYLNNTDKENTSIKSLSINNIKISSPELGTPYLYKKNLKDLGKCSFNEDSIIENEFNFNIIDSKDEINYQNFELLNNGSTPISLGYYNKNVKKDFITDKAEILYNGILLKDALIPQTSLKSMISFSINIITNTDEHYMCNVNFDIPFENGEDTLYNTGYISKELNKNELNNFIRIK